MLRQPTPILLVGISWLAVLVGAATGWLAGHALGQESPYLYGIHDYEPLPQEYLNHLSSTGITGWLTATVAVGHNPADTGGGDFTPASSQGHTVICRLNNGYYGDGTIPVVAEYANFATRCANYVANSQGCNLWLIGNETNLAAEWPIANGYRSYISPQDYANCFRQCYSAIKAVRPSAKVICQALAPFAGPYGGAADHDPMPLGWTDYMHQMLTAISATGGLDGIAVHINSRGYTYADVHSMFKVNGQYFSFYVYKDWVNLGTPPALRSLPYYATECNGAWYWKGGHAECGSCSSASCCYQPGWMGWIYDEINAWNQSRFASGEGIYHCVNMYRWCAFCDGWNMDGSPQKGQILSDLDATAAQHYRWDVQSGLADIIIESRSGGQHSTWYTESGGWADSSSTSTATGVTAGLGSRYGSTYRSIASLKQATFTPRMTNAGRYRVYATWPTHSLVRSPILYRVTHADGVTEIDVDQTKNANTWFLLGDFRFRNGLGGSVCISNEHINISGSMFASAVRFTQTTVLPARSKADLNEDGDIDLSDFGILQRCLTVADVVPTEPACQAARMDADNDVDGTDLSLLVGCLSGAGVSGNTACPP